jgi:hypothetical protein
MIIGRTPKRASIELGDDLTDPLKDFQSLFPLSYAEGEL